MKEVVLGKKTQSGDVFTMDVEELIRSRLLVQANSGGGKTHALRKIMEMTFGAAQHIILDIEGEFSVLRKKFDYVLIGDGGDGISADPAHAALLARKVLQLGVSVIINLYELQHYQRLRFVRNFLESMINAPKNLWRPCIIVLDEAHIFAPEKTPSESTNAVIDMCSRGRKRGYCLIPATQRPAKLHKDVAAECGNKLIGVANMDIDRDRAAKELGFRDQATIMTLRDLSPGEFYAVGPAFSKQVTAIKVGELQVKDSPGKEVKAAAPTANLKSILETLSDLPREAAEEAETIASLKERVRALEKDLSVAKAQVGMPQVVERPVANFTGIQEYILTLNATIRDRLIDATNQITEDAKIALDQWCEEINRASQKTITLEAKQFHPPKVMEKSGGVKEPSSEWGRCEKAILKFLAMKPSVAFSKVQIGAMTFYRHGSGGFNNSLAKLSKANFIERSGDGIKINEAYVGYVREMLGSEYSAPTTQSLLRWLELLPKCPQAIFRFLHEHQSRDFTKSDVAESTGYKPESGGFNNALSQLSTLGLIQRKNGMIGFNRSLM